MRIQPASPLTPPLQPGRPAAPGPAFALPENPQETRPTDATGAPAQAAALLALDAALPDDAATRARRNDTARRHGSALLAALARLQAARLGNDPAPAHEALRALAAALPQAEDPALAGIILHIAQRAAVELAREGL